MMNREMRFVSSRLAAMLITLSVVGAVSTVADVRAQEPTQAEDSLEQTRPLAWIQFNRLDKEIDYSYDRFVRRVGGTFFYYVSRPPIKLSMRVAPNPAHKLAVKWVPRDHDLPERAMTIEVNGQKKLVTKPSGSSKDKPYWDVIPVTEFGIHAAQHGETYEITVSKGEGEYATGLLGGVCLISDRSQLQMFLAAKDNVPEDPNTTFLSPGRITQKMLKGDGTMNPRRNDPVPPPQLPENIGPDKYLTAAAHFADAWLTYGIDNYGVKRTPLFADMVDSETLIAPRTGVAFDRNEMNQDTILCDHAGHQNFLRVLDALTQLTGVPKYRKAGEDAVRYLFQNYWTDSGMLVWGEHYFVDLYTEQPTQTKGELHEMKGYYPYYEFLYRVEPAKTKLMMEGIWLSHIRDWRGLSFTRHGRYNRQTLDGSAWQKPWKDPGIDFYTPGLSFANTGFELVNGALQVGILADDPSITQWGERLLYQFLRQANPHTHLISYHLYHPTQDPRQDRLLRTFGRTFPTAREKDVFIQGGGGMTRTVTGVLATYLELSKNKDVVLPEGIRNALDRDVDAIRRHLHGYFDYVYNPETHRLRYMVTDGTDLTGFVVNQSTVGYGAGKVGPAPDGWVPMSIFPSYSIALKIFPDDQELWGALRTLLKHEGVGDIGSFQEKKPTINHGTKCDYSEVLFALIDLYEVSGNRDYLAFAEVIAENVYQKRYDPKTGLFKKDADHLLSQIDAYEPLAFVTLWAAKHGRLDDVPRYNGGGRCGLGSKLILTGYGSMTVKPNDEKHSFYLEYVPGKWMQEKPELLRDANITETYKEKLRKRWNLTYPPQG